MFERGTLLYFSYPTENRVGRNTRLASRRLVIYGARDTIAQPLDPISLERRPDLRRGQWLVYGHDLDRKRYRRFYVDSMRSLQSSTRPLMRLGIYNPLDESELALFGPVYTDSRADVQRVRDQLAAVNRWLADRDQGRVAGLFPLLPKGTPIKNVKLPA